MTELAIQVATAPPLPLREFRRDVTEGLQRVIFRCLEKDRERRFHDVGKLATALEPYGGPRARISIDRVVETMEAAGIASRRESVPNGASDETREPIQARDGAGTVAAWGATNADSKRTSKRVLFAAGGLAALLLVGAGIVLLRGRPASTATTVGTPAAASTAPAPQFSVVPDVVSTPPPAPSESAVTVIAVPTATLAPTQTQTQASAPTSHARPGTPAPAASRSSATAPASPAATRKKPMEDPLGHL